MKPEYVIEHEDAEGNIKSKIKFTGSFNKTEIRKAILICVSNMADGDEVEFSKNDFNKKYVGNIIMMILAKKKGEVKRLILKGTGTGHYVPFHYFEK